MHIYLKSLWSIYYILKWMRDIAGIGASLLKFRKMLVVLVATRIRDVSPHESFRY